MPPQTLIKGRVVFGPNIPTFVNATVRIRLEDVSLADSFSRVVAEEIIPGVSRKSPATEPVPFVLKGSILLEPHKTYSVTAHVDLNGNGDFDVGDLITMQRHSLRAGIFPTQMDIRVERIG